MIARVAFRHRVDAHGRGILRNSCACRATHPTRFSADGISSYSGAHRRSPSWLEVGTVGHGPPWFGQFVGSGGSARPIAKIEFTRRHVSLRHPATVGKQSPATITFEGTARGAIA